jgi:hypothetical protein
MLIAPIGGAEENRADPRQIALRLVGEITTEYPFGVSRASWRGRVGDATWRDRRGPFDYPTESMGTSS